MPLPKPRGRIGMYDKGVGLGSFQEGVSLASKVIRAQGIRKRKSVRVVNVLLVLERGKACWASPPVIKTNATRPGDVRVRAVKNAATAAVAVKPLVDKVSNRPATLGAPKAVGFVDAGSSLS